MGSQAQDQSPGQDVAALIPRVFTPGGRLQPNSRRPDEDTPDTPKEPPAKTHKPGDQKKKRPTPDDPDKCDDENQNQEPCPSENEE